MQIGTVSGLWFCRRFRKTQKSASGMDSCAYSEVIRSCQKVGCARNRRQSHTVRRKLKLFLLMQDYAWMEYHLLIFGSWLLKCFILPQTNQRNQRVKYEETRRATPHQTSTPENKPRFQLITTILNWVMLILFHRTQSLPQFSAMLYIFWRQRSSDLNDHQRQKSDNETRIQNHRVAQDWLFDRINLDPKIQIKYVDTKKQLADMLTEGNFTRDEWNHLLRLLNISHFSLIYCSQNFSLTSWHGSDGEKDARTERRREDCGKVKADVELGLTCPLQILSTVQSPIASKSPGDTQGTLSKWLDKYRETWSKRIQSRRSVEFSSVGKRCGSGWKVRGDS